MSKTIIFDTEIFNNCSLFMGRVVENRKLIKIWLDDPDALADLRDVMESGCTFVSYNGINFDMPIIASWLAGHTQEKTKFIANTIIGHQLKHFQTYKQFKIQAPKADHIDLIEVVPGFVSLKCYMGRMHMPWLKDLPFAHDAIIAPEQREMVEKYCENDLDGTEELFRRMKEPLLMRLRLSKEHQVDLRSKSDAQMAETITNKVLNITQYAKPRESATYTRAAFIKPISQQLEDIIQQIESHTFMIHPKTGKFIFPAFLKKPIVLGNGKYQMGVGGLHSKHDKSVCKISRCEYLLSDADFQAYYPTLIVQAGLGNPEFIAFYQTLINMRVNAKEDAKRITAEIKATSSTPELESALAEAKAVDSVGKIMINGLFGKLGSSFSKLYSPDLLLAVTIGGQLLVMCLIERVLATGAEIVSANTDGIVIGASPEVFEQVRAVFREYEKLTGFTLEETPYKTYAAKDVNNYIAVKPDRTTKTKGIYAPVTLSKNPTAPICATAVSKWLAFGSDFMDTIRSAQFHEFISVRSVNKEGGGEQGDEHLGRVVRWYYTTDKTLPPISYVENGNKVAKSDGAKACMVMKDKITHPDDLDYMWYYLESLKIAKAIGCEEFLTDDEIRLITPPPKVRKPRKKKDGECT